VGAAFVCLADPSDTQVEDYQELMRRKLSAPIRGLRGRDIVDTFRQGRDGGKLHEAIDIVAPRGTPIVAVEDGIIQKLFLSKPGGLTIYEFDGKGIFCYYYAHLDRYVEGLKEGSFVHRDDIIGYVGTTGNAPPQTPHLHFAILRLGPEKQWWRGTAIDPYRLLRKLVK